MFKTIEAPVIVRGGLPLIAEVVFRSYETRDGTEYDSEVTGLFWMNKKGHKSKEVTSKVYKRIQEYDSCWEVIVSEQVSEYHALRHNF
jgi:hypothetical protein